MRRPEATHCMKCVCHDERPFNATQSQHLNERRTELYSDGISILILCEWYVFFFFISFHFSFSSFNFKFSSHVCVAVAMCITHYSPNKSTLDLRIQRNKCARYAMMPIVDSFGNNNEKSSTTRSMNSMAVCTKVFNGEFEAHTHWITMYVCVCVERESLQLNRNNGNKWKSNYYE